MSNTAVNTIMKPHRQLHDDRQAQPLPDIVRSADPCVVTTALVCWWW